MAFELDVKQKIKRYLKNLESLVLELEIEAEDRGQAYNVKEVWKLEKEVVIARKLFEGLERVTDIWLPDKVSPEHAGEARALHTFRNNYLEFIELTKDRNVQ